MTQPQTAGPAGPPGPLPQRLGQALRLLDEAHGYAGSLKCDAWDFAVELAALREAGLSLSDVRWLAYQGYVAHAVEAPARGTDRRAFRHNEPLRLAAGTCFVLTEAGAEAALQALGQQVPAHANGAGRVHVPRWESGRRRLWVGEVLVKHLKVPAENQELLLAAFEEDGWPPRIDDPLPPTRDLDPKRRLGDAIARLNGNQKSRLLRFHGDGYGKGVTWELLR